MFYMECWREMQNFLTEVVRDNTGGYHFHTDGNAIDNLLR